MRPIAVLRPEPGNSETRARIAAAGATPIALPLFEVRPLAWTPAAPDRFDALVLTSANAVRHAGAALTDYLALPVFAVGPATAGAARAAGFTISAIGRGDAIGLEATLRDHGVTRGLHLGGRDRVVPAIAGVAETIAVYASEPLPMAPALLAGLAGSVAMIHSPRAGARLAALVDRFGIGRGTIRIAAISDNARAATGEGWHEARVANRSEDPALIAAALALAD